MEMRNLPAKTSSLVLEQMTYCAAVLYKCFETMNMSKHQHKHLFTFVFSPFKLGKVMSPLSGSTPLKSIAVPLQNSMLA